MKFRGPVVAVCVATALLASGGVAAAEPDVADKAITAVDEGAMLAVADSVMERRTAALVTRAELSAIEQVERGAAAESSASVEFETAAIAAMEDMRSVLSDVDETYTASKVDLSLVSSEIDENGDAVLVVDEHGTLVYAAELGTEEGATEWVTTRRFTFQQKSGAWELVSNEIAPESGQVYETDEPVGPGIPPINEPTGIERAKMAAAVASAAPVSLQDASLARDADIAANPYPADYSVTGTSSPTRTRDYAYDYWTNYNSNYREFDLDCTNFASQALRSSGWTHKTGWYKDPEHWWYSRTNQTYSWASVGHFYNFTVNKSKRGASLRYVKSLLVGDILQADFENNGSKDHTMIVTWKSSAGVPYLTYHTSDTKNRSFNNMKASFPNARWLPIAIKNQY